MEVTFEAGLAALVDGPPERETPSRTCECGKQMTFLGDLPQSGGKRAIHIFRCYDCGSVDSEPK
jgi:hypothetical protein